MNQQEFLDFLTSCYRSRMPGGERVLQEAFQQCVNQNDARWIKENFSRLIDEIQKTAHEIYCKHEQSVVGECFRECFGTLLRQNASREEFLSALVDNVKALSGFFLSISQGRKPRAGKAFEHTIKSLFDSLHYPYTAQPFINGQPDFLLPSEKHFRENAMDCIIFTAKRTLRERWRQIVTEGTRGYLFYLATIDRNIASRDLRDIRNHRIYLVVPETIRAECYTACPNVISFETFFDQHLDPAMERWKKNGVIE